MEGERTVRVEYGDLSTIAGELQSCCVEAAGLLATMNDSMTSLWGHWTGSNSTSFLKSFDERREALARCGLRVDRFAAALASAAEVYGRLDEEVTTQAGAASKAADSIWID